jgi:hypothetical protein
MTDQTTLSREADKKTFEEELRFAKTQQWRIATAAITLLAAIFAVVHATPNLKPAEKIAGTLFRPWCRSPAVGSFAPSKGT